MVTRVSQLIKKSLAHPYFNIICYDGKQSRMVTPAPALPLFGWTFFNISPIPILIVNMKLFQYAPVLGDWWLWLAEEEYPLVDPGQPWSEITHKISQEKSIFLAGGGGDTYTRNFFY